MIPVAFDVRDPERSGIARVARCTARAFTEAARNRFSVTLCGPATKLEQLGASAWGDARVVDWSAGRLSPRAELTWPAVRRQTGPALWYFPLWDVPLRGTPADFVVMVHDLIPFRVPGSTRAGRRPIIRAWIRYATQRAARIAVPSEFTRQELIGEWPGIAGKIIVTPNGVEPLFLTEPKPLPSDVARQLPAAPFMLSVGNRKPHKNLAIGADVLRRLPELHWVIVGESFHGWEAVAERIQQLGVGDRVHVLAGQRDSVLHSLYRNSVCLFFPSRYEGFGLPLVEALASGTRVVASTAGAIVEVLGGHGTVCPTDDADAFADGVLAAMSATGPADVAGRAYAASFTWERSAAILAGAMEEIARESAHLRLL